MKSKEVDFLIIGAGPAGMVAASYLQNQGRHVLVVEKAQFPRFAVGESLIPRCMDNLEEAGLLDSLKKGGFQKKFGARFIKNEVQSIFSFAEKYGSGWDWTWQVPRADFDQLLAKSLQERGVEILFKTRVGNVQFQPGGCITTLTKENEETLKVKAKFVIDASGPGRVLAKQLKLEDSPRLGSHSSLFTHIEETHRPQGKEGKLITFEILDSKTWFWYIPFSNGKSSLGFVGPSSWFSPYKIDEIGAFKHMLGKTNYYKNRFNEYSFLFKPIQITSIAKNVSKLYGKGFALAGNSAEFLDPVFSSGVAFATESGLLAAKLGNREFLGESVNWENDYENYIRRGIHVFSSYVRAWYSGELQKLIFHPHPNPEIKRKICAVLAGYVWDRTNPFVKNPERNLKSVFNLLEL